MTGLAGDDMRSTIRILLAITLVTGIAPIEVRGESPAQRHRRSSRNYARNYRPGWACALHEPGAMPLSPQLEIDSCGDRPGTWFIVALD